MNELNEALFALDPACAREDWVRILMGFKSGGGQRDIADLWSQQADSYDRTGFDSTWRSINGQGVTEATLFKLARDSGWRPERHAERRSARSGGTGDYAKAIWLRAQSIDEMTHPYGVRKGIRGAFGAKRGNASGKLIGQDADCLVIPSRDWDGNLIGVECINADGTKQSFGRKGVLLLGDPEHSDVIHITEGWATLHACFELFSRPHGGVVAFGCSLLDRAANDCLERFSGTPIIHHDDEANRDVWDLVAVGEGPQYRARVMGRLNVG